MNRKKIFIFSIFTFLFLACVAASIFAIVKYKIFWPVITITSLVLLLDTLFAWRIIVSKRNPLAKSCWITVILIIPIIGLILFFIFGFNPIKNRSRKKYLEDHKYVLETEDYSFTKEILADKYLYRLFEYGYYCMAKPVYKDNHFEVIEDNTLLFQKSIELIRSAKEFINVQSFIFNFKGFWTKILFAELIKKANSGVKVRLLYDWLGSWHRMDKKIYKQLTQYGIEVGCFNPKGLSVVSGSTNYRLHTKSIIIDNKVALYGGSNFSDEYLSMRKSKEHWKDLNFIITGPIVNSLNTTFFNYWQNFSEWSTSETSKQNLRNDISIIFPKHKFEKSDLYAQLIVFEPDFNEFAMENELLNAIYNSHKSIKMITPYFCPPNKIIEALITKHNEGVNIEIIIHNKNFKYVQLLNYENLERLIKHGIKVYQFDGYLHSKLNIFDDSFVLTGSCNIDYRSIYLDYESWIVIYNPEFTNKMVKYFDDTLINTTLLNEEFMSKKLNKWNRFLLRILNLAKTIF